LIRAICPIKLARTKRAAPCNPVDGITLAFTNFLSAPPAARVFDAPSPAAAAANGARWLRIDAGLWSGRSGI